MALKKIAITNIDSTTNSNKYFHYQRKLNVYNVSTNYSLRNIAAFWSAKKNLKMLCLKLASEPLFLILAFIQFQSFIVLIVKVRPPSVSRLYLGQIRFNISLIMANLCREEVQWMLSRQQ